MTSEQLRELQETEAKKQQDLRRQVKMVNRVMIVVVALLIVGPIFLTWWVDRKYPSISSVNIDDLQVVGESELCPGDPLVWSYHFRAEGAGTLAYDATLWSVTPPQIKIFSVREFFTLDGPMDQELLEAWHVPETYRNRETDKVEPLSPGRYKRTLSIASPSRSTSIAIASVFFMIRDDCT